MTAAEKIADAWQRNFELRNGLLPWPKGSAVQRGKRKLGNVAKALLAIGGLGSAAGLGYGASTLLDYEPPPVEPPVIVEPGFPSSPSLLQYLEDEGLHLPQ